MTGYSTLVRIVLVESIPIGMDYGTNSTFGVPLYKAWKDLISVATQQIDVASFYWSLTGQDINVNSSTDMPVSTHIAMFYIFI